jgi:acetaldehyde dehydrogenase (acetylating)
VVTVGGIRAEDVDGLRVSRLAELVDAVRAVVQAVAVVVDGWRLLTVPAMDRDAVQVVGAGVVWSPRLMMLVVARDAARDVEAAAVRLTMMSALRRPMKTLAAGQAAEVGVAAVV